MNTHTIKRATAGVLAAAALSTVLTGCEPSKSEQRENDQKQSVVQGESLEVRNIKEKLKRENNPNHVGYVYLVNFGKPFGYYTIKGKVSSSGSQLGPEQETVCPYGSQSCQAVDSKQDDGTYGQGDSGVFFFTSTGVRVETTLDYIYSDAPLTIDVPRLDPKGN